VIPSPPTPSAPDASTSLRIALSLLLLGALSGCPLLSGGSGNAPSKPTGVSAAAGNASVAVSWSAVSGATEYTVYSVAGTTVSQITAGATATVVTGAATSQVSGLLNVTQYAFVVVASNDGGDSPDSSVVTSTPVFSVFPADNWWNQDISGLPARSDSSALIISMGGTILRADFGSANGLDATVVHAGQALVSMTYTVAPDESDTGPFPIPSNAPLGPGGELIVLDPDHAKLYEFYNAAYSAGQWSSDEGAMFDLTSDNLRPAGWASADVAGLPIYPGLVKYSETVTAGVINHALRIAILPSVSKGYITPARHSASSTVDSTKPVMGMRLRLKASFNDSGYHGECKVITAALKKYGAFIADVGNSGNLWLSGMPDANWNDTDLKDLNTVSGNDFEIVDTGAIEGQ
jgi:hypothetical protein